MRYKERIPLVCFLQRFYVPSGLNRYYFLYGKPIRTTPEMASDKEQVAEVYRKVQRDVEDCITFLLEQRENDPFKHPLKRLLHERTTGAQAPTFSLPPHLRL
jgi:hypothetical protein